MFMLIGGIAAVIIGVVGFFLWWEAFILILKGGVPIMLILGGILAVYVGQDAMQDKLREEQQNRDEKLEKAQEELERVKAQSDQYREELEKLKGQKENPA
ncbi:MAG: hypothetical protein AB1558_06285 [Thermodesulfobacteriota bacterium]